MNDDELRDILWVAQRLYYFFPKAFNFHNGHTMVYIRLNNQNKEISQMGIKIYHRELMKRRRMPDTRKRTPVEENSNRRRNEPPVLDTSIGQAHIQISNVLKKSYGRKTKKYPLLGSFVCNITFRVY